MGTHRTMFGEPDANALHIQQTVDDEIETRVGQRRITHGRTDALKPLGQHLRDGKLLLRGIAPELLAHLFVQPFGGGLSQPVGQGLGEHPHLRIVGIALLHLHIHRGSEDAKPVSLAAGCRTDEVGQTQARPLHRVGRLLPEHRHAHLSQEQVVSIAHCIVNPHHGMGGIF